MSDSSFEGERLIAGSSCNDAAVYASDLAVNAATHNCLFAFPIAKCLSRLFAFWIPGAGHAAKRSDWMPNYRFKCIFGTIPRRRH